MPAQTTLLYVYYDGTCPICRRDRARYERWAGETGEAVIWCDFNQYTEHLRSIDVEPDAAMMSLHVEDANGQLYEGIDAYVLLMKRVPRLRPAAFCMALPGVKSVLKTLYQRWVRQRLEREGRLP
jgi:predicted DCC family thiol-disulfide oxidoreductase YuxK